MRLPAVALFFALALALGACGTRPVAQPAGHIVAETTPARAESSIPAPVRMVPLPPPPEAREPEIRYSVVVANQPVRDVLLAMARETKINFDIHPGIEGSVNLNAIDQTMKQILNRIARQVDMRWEVEGQTITVMPDTPFLRNYRVDYVNMSRDVTETMGIATQIISGTVTAGGAAGAASAGSGANNSTLTITGTSRHRFWETLERNIKDMLRETDKLLPEGSSETFVQNRGQTAAATTQTRTTTQPRTGRTTTSRSATSLEAPGESASREASEFVEQRLTFREAASVIVNPEAGIVSVRATSRQHEKVQAFLDEIMGSSRRQVVIEATIVEVALNDNYQSGVDWSALGLSGLGYSFRQAFTVPNIPDVTNQLSTSNFSIQYNNPNAAAGGSISSTIKLLDSFGKTRVLSSPKLMVLNNQTAMLKVVDNKVYFTIKADTVATANVAAVTTFTTTQNVVPVGFIMNVTAQISDGDMVTLNVRPTVTRIIDQVKDPNPSLSAATPSLIPVTQTREMESVLKVASGQTAILGGLMIDSFQGKTDGLPIASRIPLLGNLVSARNDLATKSELVIFIRPTVVRNASVEGDLAAYRRFLPDREFFRDTRTPFPCIDRKLQRLEDRARADDYPCSVEPAPPSSDPSPGGLP